MYESHSDIYELIEEKYIDTEDSCNYSNIWLIYVNIVYTVASKKGKVHLVYQMMIFFFFFEMQKMMFSIVWVRDNVKKF